MTYEGILTKKGICAICKKSLPVGTLTYFDPTKRQGSHLAHILCYDKLRAGRETHPPKGKEAKSTEHLAPPF